LESARKDVLVLRPCSPPPDDVRRAGDGHATLEAGQQQVTHDRPVEDWGKLVEVKDEAKEKVVNVQKEPKIRRK
jgi:hypothetical protein